MRILLGSTTFGSLEQWSYLLGWSTLALSSICVIVAIWPYETLKLAEKLLRSARIRGVSTFSGTRPQETEWIRKLTRRGWAKINGLVPVLLCLGVMLGASVMIPYEHAKAGVKVIRDQYLPHVPEEMDQYHFWMEGENGERTYVTFCQNGLKPPWNEGQTITWMRVRVDNNANCLELLGYDGKRDRGGKIVNE